MAKPTPSNQQISKLLNQIAAVLEVTNQNRFRIIAYRNASEAAENANESLYGIWQKGNLTSIQGIGGSLAAHLGELFESGKSKYFDEIKKSVPAGMFPLLELEGVGAKKAFKISMALKLNNDKDTFQKVIKASRKDQIANLEGMGKKSQDLIVKAIKNFSTTTHQRLRIDLANQISQEIIEYLKQFPHVKKASVLGSQRRGKSTVGDIDIGLSSDNFSKAIDHIRAFPKIHTLIASGANLVRFTHDSGQNVDIKLIETSSWGSLLQHFTGSKAHNVALREHALQKGYSLSEQGIKKKNGTKKQTFTTEKAFYQFLDMDWIPPEIRENQGEIELALKHKLPVLIKPSDIKGDLHTHTSYDWGSSHDFGKDSPLDMITKAKALGYQYIGIGDHNPSTSTYTQKEIVSEVKKRTLHIRNQKSKAGENSVKKRTPHVYTSLEVDIRPDGTLALPKNAHQHLNYIVASVHSSMNLTESQMTNRIIKAISTPKVKILGHPTGGLINKRPSYSIDWTQIFKACKNYSVALEINANPARLDINDTIARSAISAGVHLVINTDAHATQHLDFTHYGVNIARRAWATTANIVNSWPLSKFEAWLRK